MNRKRADRPLGAGSRYGVSLVPRPRCRWHLGTILVVAIVAATLAGCVGGSHASQPSKPVVESLARRAGLVLMTDPRAEVIFTQSLFHWHQRPVYAVYAFLPLHAHLPLRGTVMVWAFPSPASAVTVQRIMAPYRHLRRPFPFLSSDVFRLGTLVVYTMYTSPAGERAVRAFDVALRAELG